MHFIVPMPPNRANDRSHWWKVHRDKKEYWEKLDNVQLVAHEGYVIPRPPPRPWPKAKASGILYVWSFMDQFNAGNRIKWLEDWLVKRGYIADDSLKALVWDQVPQQIIDRKFERVELILEVA